MKLQNLFIILYYMSQMEILPVSSHPQGLNISRKVRIARNPELVEIFRRFKRNSDEGEIKSKFLSFSEAKMLQHHNQIRDGSKYGDRHRHPQKRWRDRRKNGYRKRRPKNSQFQRNPINQDGDLKKIEDFSTSDSSAAGAGSSAEDWSLRNDSSKSVECSGKGEFGYPLCSNEGKSVLEQIYSKSTEVQKSSSESLSESDSQSQQSNSNEEIIQNNSNNHPQNGRRRKRLKPGQIKRQAKKFQYSEDSERRLNVFNSVIKNPKLVYTTSTTSPHSDTHLENYFIRKYLGPTTPSSQNYEATTKSPLYKYSHSTTKKYTPSTTTVTTTTKYTTKSTTTTLKPFEYIDEKPLDQFVKIDQPKSDNLLGIFDPFSKKHNIGEYKSIEDYNLKSNVKLNEQLNEQLKPRRRRKHRRRPRLQEVTSAQPHFIQIHEHQRENLISNLPPTDSGPLLVNYEPITNTHVHSINQYHPSSPTVSTMLVPMAEHYHKFEMINLITDTTTATPTFIYPTYFSNHNHNEQRLIESHNFPIGQTFPEVGNLNYEKPRNLIFPEHEPPMKSYLNKFTPSDAITSPGKFLFQENLQNFPQQLQQQQHHQHQPEFPQENFDQIRAFSLNYPPLQHGQLSLQLQPVRPIPNSYLYNPYNPYNSPEIFYNRHHNSDHKHNMIMPYGDSYDLVRKINDGTFN